MCTLVSTYVHVSTHTFEVHLNMVYNVVQVMVLTLVYTYNNMLVLMFICSITIEYQMGTVIVESCIIEIKFNS